MPVIWCIYLKDSNYNCSNLQFCIAFLSHLCSCQDLSTECIQNVFAANHLLQKAVNIFSPSTCNMMQMLNDVQLYCAQFAVTHCFFFTVVELMWTSSPFRTDLPNMIYSMKLLRFHLLMTVTWQRCSMIRHFICCNLQFCPAFPNAFGLTPGFKQRMHSEPICLKSSTAWNCCDFISFSFPFRNQISIQKFSAVLLYSF